MTSTYILDDLKIHLAAPEIPPQVAFSGRDAELRLCKAAFGLTPDWRIDPEMIPLHFRLEGAPGVGKNEIVYEIARQLAKSVDLPFYSIQGHEEMTPEDLSILTVPDPAGEGLMPFRMQASPLATALYTGGLFFFDEISRVPARALTPLASVLDRRRSLYSASSGLTIRPRNAAAAERFRFCCALNTTGGNAGEPMLPDYIDERTLPVIKVDPPDIGSLREILERNVAPSAALLDNFEEWYRDSIVKEMSVRQAIALVVYVMRTSQPDEPIRLALDRAAPQFVRAEQLRDDRTPL
jgi:midasin (ATPase involved in ribosome maturation)